jgi:hypothetical protein
VQTAIVIPIYKPFESCSLEEKVSLKQALAVFKNKHDLFFTGPVSLAVSGYAKYLKERNLSFQFIPYPDHYFSGIAGYNALCVSKTFYKPFLAYDYMLLYQLDAFAFSDELDYWCAQGYDYIGAPWCEGWGQAKPPLKFIGAGNGGFSLRKVDHFYKIAAYKPFNFFYRLKRKVYTNYQSTPWLTRLPLLWRFMKLLQHQSDQEDHFWAEEAPKYFKWFRVAPPEVALSFSFEAAPEELYKLNGYRLPFGCHAWEKYGYQFWQPFIMNDGRLLA